MEKLDSRPSVSETARPQETPLSQWHNDERVRVSCDAIGCRFPNLLARLQAAERFHRDCAELALQFRQDLLPYQMGHAYE